MQPGKLASQAGHAYVGAFLSAYNSPQGQAYAQLAPGTKVCLQGTLKQLGHVVEQLKQDGIPHFVVVDSGCENFYEGRPVITALGFGPSLKESVEHITRRFKLL